MSKASKSIEGGGKADLLILCCSMLELREDTVAGPLQGMVPPLAG